MVGDAISSHKFYGPFDRKEAEQFQEDQTDGFHVCDFLTRDARMATIAKLHDPSE